MAAKPSLNRREMIAGSTTIATTVAATSACSQELGKSYPDLTAAMGHKDGSGHTADPMDIPKEMARVIVIPAGKRPLRSAVHPSF